MRWVGSGSVTELVSVDDQLKAHCNLTGTGTTYDTILTSYVKTAGIMLEQMVGYPLRYPNVVVYYETDGCNQIILPKNINAITTYHYLDADTYTAQTFTNIVRNDYFLYSELLSSEIKTNTRYKITCTGTVNASETIKHACRMLVAEMFENRENHNLKTTGGATNYGRSIEIYLAGEIALNL